MSSLFMYAKVFAVGGLICVIGQILMQLTKLTSARILVLFVVSGAILTALGLYKPLVDFAGAGATVPLTGFGYSLATGAMEAGIGAFGIVGPIVLIISALLTAAYLLQLTINGFFPGSDFDYSTLENKEPGKLMTVPMLILAVGVVLCGVLAQPLTNVIATAAAAIL